MSTRLILRIVVILLLVLVISILAALLLGRGSSHSASAASMPLAGDICAQNPGIPACSGSGKIIKVVRDHIVPASASSTYPDCFMTGVKTKYTATAGVMFRTLLTQLMCARGHQIVSVGDPVFTHDVTTIGAVLGWNDLNRQRISSSYEAFDGYQKGSYRTTATIQFEQKGCIPIVNACQSLGTETTVAWIRGFYNRGYHWGIN